MDIEKIIISRCRIECMDSKNRITDFLSRVGPSLMAASNNFRGVPSFKRTIKTVGFPMDQHYYLDQKKPWGGRFLWGMVGQVGQVGRGGRMRQMTDDRGRRTEDRRQIEKKLETTRTGWKIRRGAQGKNRDHEKRREVI